MKPDQPKPRHPRRFEAGAKTPRQCQSQRRCEKHGLAAYLLAGREITPEVLLEFSYIDAYINTACPRISLDAPGKFQKPILTFNELRVVRGEVSWESLLKGGLFEN